MFEAIAVRRRFQVGPVPLDLGSICEALLFYQKVHLLLDAATLSGLLKQAGIDNILTLVSSPHVSASYFGDILACATQPNTPLPLHTFAVVTPTIGKKTDDPIPRETLTIPFVSVFGRSWNDRKVLHKFLSKVHFRKYHKLRFDNQNVAVLAVRDLEDRAYVGQLAKFQLAELLPSFRIPSEWYFRAVLLDDGFVVDTNFDFSAINQALHAQSSTTVALRRSAEITPLMLIENVLETRTQIMLSADYMAESMISEAVAAGMRLKFQHLLNRSDQNKEKISSFESLIFPEGRSIAEAINSGARTLSDFLKLLDKADRFKKWISSTHPDEQLVNEYLRAVTATSWFDNLPPKALRFALFTGAGLLADAVLPTGYGTATGVGLGAGDTFLLDKFIKGWKPNQFIEGPLHTFLK